MSTVSPKLQSNLYLIKLPPLEKGGGRWPVCKGLRLTGNAGQFPMIY